MDEKRAREILGEAIRPGDWLRAEEEFSHWPPYGHDNTTIQLDGRFTADELEAMAWWMRNKTRAPEGAIEVVDTALRKIGET
jgi:hypothetical protein